MSSQFRRVNTAMIGTAVLACARLLPAQTETGTSDWRLNPSNGHWYKATAEETWSGAEADAIAAGGHLATISSYSEQLWVVSAFSDYLSADNGLWIGLNQAPGSAEPTGGWSWISGETSGYRFWQPGKPDNNDVSGNENGALLQADPHPQGEWDDKRQDRSFHGLIERDTDPSGCTGSTYSASVTFDSQGTGSFSTIAFPYASFSASPYTGPNGDGQDTQSPNCGGNGLTIDPTNQSLLKITPSSGTSSNGTITIAFRQDAPPDTFACNVRQHAGTTNVNVRAYDLNGVIVDTQTNVGTNLQFSISNASGLSRVEISCIYPFVIDCIEMSGFEQDSLSLVMPDQSLSLDASDAFGVSWIDCGATGLIQLFLDSDLSAQPWLSTSSTRIQLPASIDAAGAVNSVNWSTFNIPPGTYSVWGELVDGSNPAVRSKAPGQITINAFDEMTEPEVVDGPIEASDVPNLILVRDHPFANKLFIVVHGYNGILPGSDDLADPTNPNWSHRWIRDIAEDVAQHIELFAVDKLWDVGYMDWHDHSDRFVTAHNSTVFGTGRNLGINWAGTPASNYDRIEVVAHSAGTGVADGISDAKGGVAEVYLHLLDAYIPLGRRDDVGLTATQALNYYDDSRTCISLLCGEPLPLTQTNLVHAHNVDVSCRHDDMAELPPEAVEPWEPDALSWTDHGMPWVWFRESSHAAAVGSPYPDNPYGVAASGAYLMGTPMLFANNGNSPVHLGCSQTAGTACDGVVEEIVLDRVPLDPSTSLVTVSTTGTVTTDINEIVLSSGTTDAWANIVLPLDRTMIGLQFNVEYISIDPGAEGYLTAYWDGVQLAAIDERYQGVGAPTTDGFVFTVPVGASDHVLSFRLDSNGAPESMVRITGIQTGIMIDADINDDCVADMNDLCAWVDDPIDLDGDGAVQPRDLLLLADALGVSEIDRDGNMVPDICDPCDGDTNGDMMVDVDDLNAILSAWGDNVGIGSQLDLAGMDGVVNVDDLNVVLGHWDAGCG